MEKKNGKLGVYTDLSDVNLAMPKDKYVMLIANMMVDSVANHGILTFMDGHFGYNQIYLVEEDVAKIVFRCPQTLGIYEWLVMSFGLKNIGAIYQWAMNAIFHELVGKLVEVYINDVVAKSIDFEEPLGDLKDSLLRMRFHTLKMNHEKCAFGVLVGKFLGFLVHQRGIEVDKNKAKALLEARPPQNRKELQSRIGKINFTQRFIANSIGKLKAFSPLLKLKDSDTFKWEIECQEAFE